MRKGGEATNMPGRGNRFIASGGVRVGRVWRKPEKEGLCGTRLRSDKINCPLRQHISFILLRCAAVGTQCAVFIHRVVVVGMICRIDRAYPRSFRMEYVD